MEIAINNVKQCIYMATIKDIIAKCKEGLLEEAYSDAIGDWEADPTHAWAQREVAWALYYRMKAYAERGDFNQLMECLDKLRSLNRLSTEQDAIIFDNVLFAVSHYIKEHVSPTDPSAHSRLSAIFSRLRGYHFLPSKGYSYLLRNLLKFAETWADGADFFDWWNLDNLSQEDFVPYVTEGGNRMMTLAERAVIANSKALLRLRDSGRIEAFLPKLDAVMNEHPERTYPGYFYGKLLLVSDDNEQNAIKVVLPFARKKASSFWVWSLLADVYKRDSRKQLACLLRAVNCRAQEAFLSKVRIKLADYYVKCGERDKARFHIDKVVNCYRENGWRFPFEIKVWLTEPWFNTATPDGNVDVDYRAITDDILCEGAEEAIAIVTYCDPQTQRVSMVYGWQQRLFHKLSIQVSVGAVLKINYVIGANGRAHVLKVAQGSFTNDLPYAKVVSGTVSRRQDKPFAFLRTAGQDYFVPPQVVQRFQVEDGDDVKALVVYDFDKKKATWNWLCININKQ